MFLYHNHLYKKYQAERIVLDGQMKQKSQTVRDKWRETELRNMENNPSGNTLGSIARAISQFLREKYYKPSLHLIIAFMIHRFIFKYLK